MPASQIYLASASPRRRALLDEVGLRFEVVPVDIDETPLKHESAFELPIRLALAKAGCAADLLVQDERAPLPVLAADTCVSVGGQILGKPEGLEQAMAMLRQLSGRTHVVFTAVALRNRESSWHRLSRTRVRFKRLSQQEIEAYCASGEPNDKAGGYGIQGKGGAFVNRIEGSYTGVMGLPMYETHRLLKMVGIDWL